MNIYDKQFADFFKRLIKYEGGYVNDPDDPGGETKWGISKRAYPKLDIKNLTEEDAKGIYYRDYYQKLNIPAIVDGRIAWQIFDFGVNAGVSRSAKMIQGIVGAKTDGVIGPNTVGKINTYIGRYPLYIEFLSERLKYYMMLTEVRIKNLKYLKGWVLRAMEL